VIVESENEEVGRRLNIPGGRCGWRLQMLKDTVRMDAFMGGQLVVHTCPRPQLANNGRAIADTHFDG